MFVAENVKGILSMGEGRILHAILEEFSDCGYDMFYKLLNAKEYAVPQDRERVFIADFRSDLKVREFQFPPPHNHFVPLREALKNMPEPTPDEICQAPYSSRHISRNRKRGWNEVFYTIPVMAKQIPLWSGSPDMIKIDKNHWKFGENNITRRFSWREFAVIQTFPPHLEFAGNLTSKYQQIGNAVPVKLAESVAESLYEVLSKI